MSVPREQMRRGFATGHDEFLAILFGGAALAFVLAGLVLLSDAGIAPALRYLFFASEPSYLSVGAWTIVVGMCSCSVLAFLWKVGIAGRSVAFVRVLLVVASIAGLVAALYTGLFLSGMKAVPLWNTPWLTALFVSSSLSCGVVLTAALAKVCGIAERFSSYVKVLVKADLVLIVLELLCAAALVGVSLVGTAEGPTAVARTASALDLIGGESAWIWWGGFVGLGLFATASLDVSMLRANQGWPGRLWSVLGVAVCVLAGAFALRYCIIAAGAHPVSGF